MTWVCHYINIYLFRQFNTLGFPSTGLCDASARPRTNLIHQLLCTMQTPVMVRDCSEFASIRCQKHSKATSAGWSIIGRTHHANAPTFLDRSPVQSRPRILDDREAFLIQGTPHSAAYFPLQTVTETFLVRALAALVTHQTI